MSELTIRRIVEQSIARANRWHNGDMNEWSALEWAGAMCGEAGEAANAAKKLKRLECQIQSINNDVPVGASLTVRHFTDVRSAEAQVAKEVCDTLLYGVLVMARVGCTPEQVEELIAEVFNRKSEEYQFPERL